MRRLRLLITATLVLSSTAARANWIQNGNPLSLAGSSAGALCVSDNAGGAIMVWSEIRTTSYDLYAQRIDGFGNTLWATNGVAVCTAAGDQAGGGMMPDGAGGAIIAWTDGRSGNNDVYVQRINSAGASAWTANGVALCTATDSQLMPQIVTDGAGGAIVTWQDLRSGTNFDVYARRINSVGTPQWLANGVVICTATGNQSGPTPVVDGVGGAIICWGDFRSGTSDIFAQRVNGAGTVQWAANGVSVCNAAGNQAAPGIVSDSAGGAVIAWDDARGANDNIYAQRMNSSGNPQWTLNGVELCIAVGDQSNLSLITDGAGGAIAVWQDQRVGPAEVDLYGQRVNSFGTVVWEWDGVPICASTGIQSVAALAPDGQGGVIATWDDTRSGNPDIYAQLVSTDGAARWQLDGMPLCTLARNQTGPSCVPDGSNGVIVAWDDARANDHPYALRVELRYGYWGRPEPTIVSASDNPSDQGGQVIVHWDASQRDLFFNPGISHYSLWRATDVVAVQASASSTKIITTPAEIDPDFEGNAIWEEITPAGPAFWEWIANQPAVYQTTYSLLAPTRQDSIPGVSARHYFKVIAHEYDFPQTRTWESGVANGYSLDNLAPAAPFDLAGVESPWDITLTWTSGGAAPDFDHYAIYRGVGFVMPTPQYLIATSDEPSHLDDSVPGGILFYVVTAVDIHGNESGRSNVWSPSGTTPVGDTPSIRTLTLLDNAPNPFSGSTTLRVGLPKASDVEIDVFDVAGRRVRSEHTSTLAAGWRDISFDAHDAAGHELSSGVYFYRVKAAGQTITRKMVIAR